MSLAETAALGAAAKQALEVIDPACEAVKAAIVSALIRVSPEQTARILALHAAIQNVDAVRQMVSSYIANGAIAEHDLLAEQ